MQRPTTRDVGELDLIDQLRDAELIENFDVDTADWEDDTIIVLGHNVDTGETERRTYDAEVVEDFEDCWDQIRDEHYTRTTGYRMKITHRDTEVLKHMNTTQEATR